MSTPGLLRLSERPELAGQVLTETEGFGALNAASWRDGAVVDGAVGVVHLVHVSTGENRLACPRHVVRVAAGQQLKVVEHWLGEGPSLCSAVTEVQLAEGAQLEHVLVQTLGAGANHVQTIAVSVGEGATYTASSVQTGGALVRIEFDVALVGEQATTDLSGLALVRGSSHVDHHVTVHHLVPHGTSRQSFRSILDDKSRAVFTGKVVVALDAQKTDSQQSNRVLLLSDDAVANSRPQLEIYADDVICAHGATVGQLDDESMFYLCQRGLSADQARALLVEGFAAEIVVAIDESVRAPATQAVSAWLGV